MSLIFKTLQKLDADMEATPSGSGDLVSDTSRSRSGYLRWMIPVAIGLVLVLALGCGVVYAVQYFNERLPDKMRPPERQKVNYREPPQATLPPPKSDVDATAADNHLAALQSQEAVARGETAPKYQFHPPDREKRSAGGQPIVRVDRRLPQAPALNTAPITTSSPWEHSQDVRSGVDKKATPAAPPIVDAQREAAERARRAALEKSARIARLVRQIEMALAGSTEAGDPSALLDQLARLKGEHHPYVAKLRAYYNFQRGNMALAQTDLHKVIAAHPDDLEAGINLAIIEIQDQQYDKAMARLKALRQVYPENERIADLIKRLR
jgi:tetratricopeptide (TPR) repeat protein